MYFNDVYYSVQNEYYILKYLNNTCIQQKENQLLYVYQFGLAIINDVIIKL